MTHVLSLLGVYDLAPSYVLCAQFEDSPNEEVQEQRSGRKQQVALSQESAQERQSVRCG